MVQIMRWVRANLLDPSHTDLEMHVDILIDGDLKVSSGPPYCGWLGKFRSNECFPFICRPNSKGIYCIDFGQNPRDQGMTQSDRLTVQFSLLEITASVT